MKCTPLKNNEVAVTRPLLFIKCTLGRVDRTGARRPGYSVLKFAPNINPAEASDLAEILNPFPYPSNMMANPMGRNYMRNITGFTLMDSLSVCIIYEDKDTKDQGLSRDLQKYL